MKSGSVLHSARDLEGKPLDENQAMSLLGDALKRRVCMTRFLLFEVTTWFLVFDRGIDKPIYYETVVLEFGFTPLFKEQCETHEEAFAMHERGVEWAKKNHIK
jgi:hypothetical protein